MLFAYWAIVKETKEKINFISDMYFEIGQEMMWNDKLIIIEDLSVENPVSCMELKLNKEVMGLC
jgi:hypothetical protein